MGKEGGKTQSIFEKHANRYQGRLANNYYATGPYMTVHEIVEAPEEKKKLKKVLQSAQLHSP